MSYQLFKNYINFLYDELTLLHVTEVSLPFIEGSDEWFLSLCHDLIEDTKVDINYLHFTLSIYNKEYLLNSIYCLTRLESETYFNYISRIKDCNIENCLCKKVKLRDLLVNYGNKSTLKPSLCNRYEKAIRMLKCD